MILSQDQRNKLPGDWSKIGEKTIMSADKKIRILIVEDDEINRKLLTNILNTIGFNNIIQAQNGKIGWETLQKNSVDLIITDWMMPEMDGLDLLKNIRESESNLKKLPVLMITALGKQDDIMKAAKLDVNGYIVKPFSVNTVLSKIEEIMS